MWQATGMKTTIGVLALLMASGIGSGCDGDDMSLMAGVGPGRVGGPAKIIPANPNTGVGVLGQGAWQSLVKFQAQSQSDDQTTMLKSPSTLTASIFAQGNSGQAGIFAGVGFGPLVGLAKWGAGNSGEQLAEFDVGINSLVQVQGGGTLLTVVGDYLEIQVRNDGSVIPRAGDQALGAQNQDAPTAGATIGMGNRPGSAPLTLTKWAAFNPAGGLAALGTALVTVPAFAKSFRVFRADATQPISIQVFQDGVQSMDGPYNVAANVPAPELPLGSTAARVVITNTGAAALTAVGAVFTLGL